MRCHKNINLKKQNSHFLFFLFNIFYLKFSSIYFKDNIGIYRMNSLLIEKLKYKKICMLKNSFKRFKMFDLKLLNDLSTFIQKKLNEPKVEKNEVKVSPKII